ncbi:MAG TPA: DUF1801 domain-containing protein [Pirellulaceae bacterium]|nr:DUF1801 domain-containing protein [Pirellulaceae bacterium]
MGTKDPRVDIDIEKAADFAKPILTTLRKLVHQACPEVAESIKWGVPAFDYKGPFVGMAAFKKHCSFGFWKAALLFEAGGSSEELKKSSTWGAPGPDPIPAKMTRLADLPADAKILALLKRAKKLNDDGVTIPKVKSVKPVPPVPVMLQVTCR